MWIKTTRRTSDGRPVTRRLKSPDMDDTVEFTDTGTAQVPADVGEYLVNEYEHIVPSDSDAEPEDATGDGATEAAAVDAEPARTSAETGGEPEDRGEPFDGGADDDDEPDAPGTPDETEGDDA